MKNIKNFIAEKYKNNPEYTAVAEDIYQMGNEYVTSFSFEPEIGEEKLVTCLPRICLKTC